MATAMPSTVDRPARGRDPGDSATVEGESMRDRFYLEASALLAEDPRVAIVLADIGTGALADAARRHPDRVLNVGIREQLLIGAAAGLAMAGLRPIVHSYTPFLIERPFEQLKLDLGHNDLGAVLVSVGASADASIEGRTHQAPEDVRLVASLPGWRIDVPGHPEEVAALLRAAVASNGRVYIRLATHTNRAPVDEVLASPSSGHMTVVRRGGGATIIAVGPTLDPVLDAVADLDVTVLYAATIRPFDGSTLRAMLTAPEVVLVEPYLAGTSADVVTERLRARPHRLLALGVPLGEWRRYGTPDDHRAAHGLDAAGIRASIRAFLDGYE
jgi:transketolase